MVVPEYPGLDLAFFSVSFTAKFTRSFSDVGLNHARLCDFFIRVQQCGRLSKGVNVVAVFWLVAFTAEEINIDRFPIEARKGEG